MDLREVPPERVDILYFKKVGVEFRVAWKDGESSDDLSTDVYPGIAVSNKFGITVLADITGACAAK